MARPQETPPATEHPGPGFRTRLRAWAAFGAALAVWLAAAFHAGRIPTGWPGGITAWSSGDATAALPRPGWRVRPAGGARTAVDADGDVFHELPVGATLELGRVRADPPWAVSAWFRLPQGRDGTPPSATLVSVTGPEFRVHVGVYRGQPSIRIRSFPGKADMTGPEGIADPKAPNVWAGEWHHLLFLVGGTSLQVRIDGVEVASARVSDPNSFLHAAVRLEEGSIPMLVDVSGRRLEGLVPDSGPEVPSACDFDDVAVLGIVPDPTGIQRLHDVGRGSLRRIVGAEARSERILSLGTPWFAGAALLLVAASLAGPVRRRLPTFFRPVHQPSTWMLGGGLALTVTAWVLMTERARKTEQERFLAHVQQLSGELKSHLGLHGQLLVEFRDWVAAGNRRSPEELEDWVRSRRLDESPFGFLGIGLAERVLPEDEERTQAAWSRRHGFPFRFEPGPAPGEPYPEALLGRPRLPVVLFHPHGLHEVFWRTNGSILGRDLLRVRPGSPGSDPGPGQVVGAVASGKTMGGILEDAIPADWYGETQDTLRLVAPVQPHRPADPGRIRPEEWQGAVFLLLDTGRLLGNHWTSGNPEFAFTLHPARGPADACALQPPSAACRNATWRERRRIAGLGTELDLEAWTTPEFDRRSPRGAVHWVVAGGFLLTLLATGLLRVQNRTAERSEEMAHRLQSANRRLAQSDRERARISRDLHDGTVQNLYAVGLHLQHALRHLGSNPARSREGVEAGQRLVQETLVELREFLVTLKDEPSTHRTLADLLEGLVGRLRRTLPIRVELEIAVETRELPRRSVLHLVNLVREAVSNALRHAEPSGITIRLLPGKIPGWMYLEVADDGRGFDLSKSRRDGFGMVSLLERASELRGALSLDSKPGHGTVLRLQFPEKPGDESTL